MMGKEKLDWQDDKSVLERFGRGRRRARKEYLEYLRGDLGKDIAHNLGGGELIRILTGIWGNADEVGETRRHIGEEAILGGDSFIEKVLRKADEKEDRKSRLERRGWTTGKVIQKAAKIMGLKPGQVRGNSKEPKRVRARALACKWLVGDLGKTTVEASRVLRVTQPSVVRQKKKGYDLEKEMKVRLGPRR